MVKNMSLSKSIQERNYGIDLLRIIAMIYVVILHTLGAGGILDNLEIGTHKYMVAWFLEIFAFCAVDVFALITGYISYRKNDRKNLLQNYIKLWLQVVFYCLVITLCFHIFIPLMVTKRTYLYSFLPVLTNQYWYFTAYTGIVLFMPIVDIGLRKIKDNDAKKIFILLIILFTGFAIVNDRFGLNGGYTVIWLLILYLLGGIIKKCNLFEKIKSKYILMIMLLSFIITYLFFILNIKYTIAEINITSIFSVSYISPTILIISIGYLCIFSRIRINERIKKIIKFFSPATFSIYLLNSNHLISEYFLRNKFIFMRDYRTIIMAIMVVVFSLTFSLVAMMIDKVRIVVFKKLKMELFTEKISNCIIKAGEKIINKI